MIDGYQIVVMFRDEHCPPHVHVDGKDWSMRIKFSFWNNDTEFWDTTPSRAKPNLRVIRMLCRELEKTNNLCKARQEWMKAVKQTCMDNGYWDLTNSKMGSQGNTIINSTYDTQKNITVLDLLHVNNKVEIKL